MASREFAATRDFRVKAFNIPRTESRTLTFYKIETGFLFAGGQDTNLTAIYRLFANNNGVPITPMIIASRIENPPLSFEINGTDITITNNGASYVFFTYVSAQGAPPIIT